MIRQILSCNNIPRTDWRKFRPRSWLVSVFAALALVSPLAVLLLFGNSPNRALALQDSTTQDSTRSSSTGQNLAVAVPKLQRSDAQWKKLLTKEQYYILRQAGTERPYANRYHNHKGKGTYACVGCGNRLFNSSSKFDSGTGWPSFFKPIDSLAVLERPDDKLLTRRTEITCLRCEGHLGHVFTDGPQPTGLRYCMNSAALTFFPDRMTKPSKDAK